MAELPARPDLDQLRRQAKDLLRAANRGDAAALARMGAVSQRLSLDAAQLALARARVRELGEAQDRGRTARDPRPP